VGLRTNVNEMDKRKVSPILGLELDPSAVQSVASRYTDCAIPAPNNNNNNNILLAEI
jgi:hypothetical protein